ncbi:MAG TPA: YtxH domain-containing protein [Gemmatimonadales bacterium]|nr:YtxH domain-containing protein [Gemmatimonadales bacterium]
MRKDFDNFDLEDADRDEGGSLLGLALFGLALGAGAAVLFAPAEGARTRRIVSERLKSLRGDAESAVERVQRELGRREGRRRRERRSSALLGLAVGAGLATLLTPESGPNVRRRITERLRGAEEEVPEVDRVVREPLPDPEPAA